MWETVLQWDQQAFLAVNNGWSNGLFDAIMPFFREKWFWAPLYLFIVVFVFINFNRKSAAFFVLGLVLTVALCDVSSSRLIKPNVQRLRPCRAPALQEKVVLRASCGGGYSFTSSHAANHFGVAAYAVGLLGFAFRRMWIWMPGWAAAIALAQVYVGVHYPLDVVAGAVLGWAIGAFVARMFRGVKEAFIAGASGN